MQAFPHHYAVSATAAIDGDVELTSGALRALRSASPAEFDGPGDQWSPETFLVGAVADCFVLTFRAVARASKLPWASLECDVIGTLDRIERVTQFTTFEIRARLEVPAGTDADVARRALDKAEHNCLISNSLKAAIHLEPEVVFVGESVTH
ncbi:MAG TPA: OsmC family protein [Vicinamibacterales bacterium]|nr:OsmC family protein [Vicinamibacterales bacterium]